MRARELVVNPMAHLLNVPSPGEADHGIALNEDELRKLVAGFAGSPLFLIVAAAAYTGMRRYDSCSALERFRCRRPGAACPPRGRADQSGYRVQAAQDEARLA